MHATSITLVSLGLLAQTHRTLKFLDGISAAEMKGTVRLLFCAFNPFTFSTFIDVYLLNCFLVVSFHCFFSFASVYLCKLGISSAGMLWVPYLYL